MHVDKRLDNIDQQLAAISSELRTGLREVRDDVSTISRHVGRPLLSWPQVLTLAVALVAAIGGLAAVAA